MKIFDVIKTVPDRFAKSWPVYRMKFGTCSNRCFTVCRRGPRC